MKKINIGKLKYIIPTVATPFIMAGCGEYITESGIIIGKDEADKTLYIDTNYDNWSDYKLTLTHRDTVFHNYAELCDPISFRIYSKRNPIFTYGSDKSNGEIIHVNGKNFWGIRRTQAINKIRSKLNKQKVR